MSERQAELLVGEGRRGDADRIECGLLAKGKSPMQARRATVLDRPIEPIPRAARPRSAPPGSPATSRSAPRSMVYHAWALMDDKHPRLLKLCQNIARDKPLARLGERGRVRTSSQVSFSSRARSAAAVRLWGLSDHQVGTGKRTVLTAWAAYGGFGGI